MLNKTVKTALATVMLLAVCHNAQALNRARQVKPEPKPAPIKETAQEKVLREKKEAANAQRKALAAEGKATNPALIAAAHANPKAKTVPVHKVQLQTAAEARAKKAAPTSRPASRTLTKQPTSMNVNQQSEELTAGIFDEPTKATASRPTPPAGLANKTLQNAYGSTFGALPGGKWEIAFPKINLQAWESAVASYVRSVAQSADLTAVEGFNTRLVNFVKQYKNTATAMNKQPIEADNISIAVETYLEKHPNMNAQVKQLATMIKNAADALNARINN